MSGPLVSYCVSFLAATFCAISAVVLMKTIDSFDDSHG